MPHAVHASDAAQVRACVAFHPSRLRRSLAAGVALIAALASGAIAQPLTPAPTPAAHTLLGNVRGPDESRLNGVHVELLMPGEHASGERTSGERTSGARAEALTDVGGGFRFDRLPDGAARLVVRRLGFRPETLTVEVPQLVGGPVVVLLERAAQPLPLVVVRETRRPTGLASAFERRRASGFGHYITRADIERDNPQRTTELLRRVPGVTFGGDGSSGVQFRNGGAVAGRCEPVYFLDGSPAGNAALDLDAISPSSIESIEVYNGAATVPAALRSAMAPGGCGAIAIWSRRADLARARRGRSTPDAHPLDEIVAQGAAFTADQVEFAALPLPGLGPVPAYPDSLRDASVRGQVVAEFVVDERGRVAPETIGIVSSTHPLFADAVRDAIAGARFTPAYRQQHVVRQVVHLPVVFEPGSVAGSSP